MKKNLRIISFKNLEGKDISKIVNYYISSNRDAINIASQFNISKFTLYKILKYNSIPTRLETKINKEKIRIKIPKDLRGYLAGIVDGEGYIFIVFSKSTQNYLCGVYIKNTNKRVLEIFVKYFGGKINFRKSSKPNEKDCYTWTCFGFKAAELCRKVLPYLIIKRKQAELLLEFSKTLKINPSDNYKLSVNIQNKRKRLISEIKALNKRGK